MDKRTCTIDGCEGKPVGRGWCSAHWQRWRNHGDPLGGAAGPRVRKAVDHPDGTRECSMCGERKPLTEAFDRDKRASGGRRSRCKSCRGSYMKDYYAETASAKKEYERTRRLADPARARSYDAMRYERDREKRIALATDATHRRRQRIKESEPERGVTRRALRAIHGDACHWCGIAMSFDSVRKGQFRPDLATIEHLIPLSKGGTHTFTNARLACWECNIRRGNRDDATWGDGSGASDHTWIHRASDLDEAASGADA